MHKRTRIGFLLIVISAEMLVIDRLSHVLSDGLGLSICGADYLQTVNGAVGDMSCGFNMDMYLVAGLSVLFAVGLLLVLTAQQKS